MINLAAGQCLPSREGESGLAQIEIEELLFHIIGWRASEADGVPCLERVFEFGNLVKALDFANQVADLAEEQGQRPALIVEWSRVIVQWRTQAAFGLHRNDFIMAAKTDELFDAAR